MANSPLAPVAQPPAPKAPGEIPVDKIKVPAGFKVELWAHGINNARAMTWGDKGTPFVSSRVAGNVYAVVDKGNAREVKVIAKGLNLYVGGRWGRSGKSHRLPRPDNAAQEGRGLRDWAFMSLTLRSRIRCSRWTSRRRRSSGRTP